MRDFLVLGAFVQVYGRSSLGFLIPRYDSERILGMISKGIIVRISQGISGRFSNGILKEISEVVFDFLENMLKAFLKESVDIFLKEFSYGFQGFILRKLMEALWKFFWRNFRRNL